MATNDELIKKIEGKFKMLKFTQDNTLRVLERNKPRDLERQLKVFEDQSDQVFQLIMEVQENEFKKETKWMKYRHGVWTLRNDWKSLMKQWIY